MREAMTRPAAADREGIDGRRCPVPLACGMEFCDCSDEDYDMALEVLKDFPSLDGKRLCPDATPATAEIDGAKGES